MNPLDHTPSFHEAVQNRLDHLFSAWEAESEPPVERSRVARERTSGDTTWTGDSRRTRRPLPPTR